MNFDQNRDGAGYSWYVVCVLLAVYTLSFIDRQIISLLVEPIKRDLNLTDTQLGLLQGFAFAIFYSFMGIPLGRLADKANRRTLIIAGISVWSVMTAYCGVASNYIQLFLGRVGVGVGEAALSPAAYSMISDYFPEEKRGKAIGLYAMGAFFGAGLAYILGGFVIEWVQQYSQIEIPFIGSVFSWKLVFFLVGAPGLLFVLLMLTVREPKRFDHSGIELKEPKVSEVFRHINNNRKVYIAIILGISLISSLTYSLFSWVPAFFIRTYFWGAEDIGYLFGLIVLVFGTAGIFFCGVVIDHLQTKGRRNVHIDIALIATAGACLFSFIFPLINNPNLALLMLAPAIFFLGIFVSLGPIALSLITPNRIRGQVIAIYLFALNFIGLGMGPTILAMITDYVFGDPALIRYSLSLYAAGIFPLTAFTFYIGRSIFGVLFPPGNIKCAETAAP